MQKKKDDEIASAKTLQANSDSKKPFRGLTIHGGSAPMLEKGISTSSIRPGARIYKTEYEYYEVGDKIGEGGMGTVHKATYIKLDKKGRARVKLPYAIKELKFNEDYIKAEPGKTINKKTELLEKFLTEVELLAKLESEHVVRIIDFDEKEDGNAYYVMEYLEGKDLESVLEHGPMNWHKTSRLIYQVCSGLEAAHENTEDKEKRPIVHRDIKPMNIFITVDSGGNQKVKVLDFGLAKINAPKIEGQPQKPEDIDGTPDYMSPEQGRGAEVDPRFDIYSVGVVMYQMLTGNTPFAYNPKAWNEFWTKVFFEIPPPPSTLAQGIPKEVDALIMRCLEKDPAKRFQSMRELKEAIKRTNTSVAVTSEISGVIVGTIDSAEGQKGAEGKKSSSKMNGDRVLISPSLLPKIEALTRPSAEVSSGTKAAWGASAAPQVKTPRRFMKWLAIGAISAASIGGIAAYSIKGSHMREPLHDRIANTPAPQPSDSQEAQKDGAPTDTATKQDSSPELTANRSITVKAKLKGVEVLIDGMPVCTTDQKGSCSFNTSDSSQPLTVRLEKKGYIQKELPVIPDADKVVDIELEKDRKAGTPPQRVPRPGKQPGTKPSITTEE